MTKLYLFDIEGTTTDIKFVHKVLFPYSAERLRDFVFAHQNESSVAGAVENVRETARTEDGTELDLAGAVEKLRQWIREDRKHPALKELQGMIWDQGYAQGHFKGHVYPDVLPFFMKIVDSGAQVGIYSSGSVHAQKLIFGHSEAGDLTPFISHYFDTKVGHKREKSSYERIAKETGLPPGEIHFFSDIPEELAAAQMAGMTVTQLLREGTSPSTFRGIKSFENF